MPHLRLSQFAAVLFLIAAEFLPVYADYTRVVQGPGDLAKFALEFQNSPDRGAHSIDFDSYGNVGTFKLDTPTDKLESLTFKRNNPDSEAVITVTSTFLDIKKMPGKITLKGLAFQLMPNAVLISGSDGSKPNGSLLIDSCFIFADTLDNTFISWLGDNTGSVEIRNSFIVVGGSRTASAKIALTAGSVLFTNNLINYSGRISATSIAKEFQFLSNTVNRTQFELTGVVDVTQPRLEFAKNLFAHHGAKDAFNAAGFFVLYYGLFDTYRVSIIGNTMYNTWSGFDSPQGKKFDEGSNNFKIDSVAGKSAGEKWNWYTETVDGNLTGLLSGGIKRDKYNVMPTDSSYNWTLPRGSLTVAFQPALYPRMIVLDTPATKLAPPPDSVFHRRIFPAAGYAHFGPFRIGSITLGAAADFGKPVLLAADSLDSLRTQASTASVKSNPSVYANTLGMARKFVLINAGNTPQGLNIRPGEGSELSPDDKLEFSKVDAAGRTIVRAPLARNLLPELRSLNTSLQVETNAIINSVVRIGVKADVRPYSPDKVYWLFRNPSDSLVPAVKSVTKPDSGKYTASFGFNSANGILDAFLVEKLSVPAGGTSIKISDGNIGIHSPQGFQLKVDSAYVPDSLVYGVRTKGYSFTWPYKESTDSVILILTKRPDQELFVKVGSSPPVPWSATQDSAGNFKIVVAEVDTGKVFFAGVPYNVIKGASYTQTFADGVNLTEFASSRSGKLQFDSTLDAEKRKSLDSVVKVYRYLGGRQMRAISVASITPSKTYGMSFAILGPKNVSKVEVYIHNGTSWLPTPHPPGNYAANPIGITNVPIEARAVAVVERLESANTYIEAKPLISGMTLTVTPTYRIDSLKMITHYCVELISVDQAGTVTPTLCADQDKQEITQTTTKTLDNAAYKIRIKYYIGLEPIDGLDFEPLKDYGFNLEKIVAAISDVAVKVPKQWSLVGFPVAGVFSTIMAKQDFPANYPDSLRKRDATFVLRVHKDTLGFMQKRNFDTLKTWSSLEVKPGNAFLIASSHEFRTVVQNDFGAHAVEPDTLDLDTGWNFIANPFPTNMVASKIRSSLAGQGLSFFGLDVVPSGNTRTYGWKPATTLRAFFGYAYYAQAKEKLIFDLLADTAGNAAKRGASVASAPDLEARLESPWGVSSMAFTSKPNRISIPFLPAPGAGPQLRVGGGPGYMIKAVSRPDQIDEPMEISSGSKGTMAFSLSRPFRSGISMRLIDLESGAIYDETEARALAVSEGARRYRLLAGDASFLESRIQAFKAAAPAETGLSQNYPNPFRGRTNVELSWPAWEGGNRTAVLRVMDLQGRTVERMELGKIRVGRQVVTLDASRWQSGVYLYRLEVTTGSRRIHLQKRLMVTP